MAKTLTEHQIARRKQLQSRISQTTGALGLASLGAFGLSKVPGSRVASATPRLRRVSNRINTKKAKDAALGLSTAGAGIGGAGSFNFASYTGAEAKKKVKKNDDAPYVGEVGIAKRYEEEIAKIGEWKTIDQRERTQRRDRKVQTAAGGAIGTGAALAAMGNQESRGSDLGYWRQEARGVKNGAKWATYGKSPVTGKRMTGREFWDANKHVPHTLNRRLTPKGKAGAGLIAGGLAVGGGAKGQQSYQQHKINQRRRHNLKKNWAPTKDKVFDSERSRKARADAYSYGAAGALGGASVLRAGRAVGLRGAANTEAKQRKAGSAANARKLKALSNKAGKQSAALAVAAPTVAYGLHRAKNSKSWEPYAKSAPSAFGITHD